MIDPLPDDLVDGWLRPLRSNAAVRRDLRRYTAGARRRHMTTICERLGAVKVPTLVVWTPEDRIQRVEHGARLAETIPGAQLKQIDDSYTLMMRDQPDRLACYCATSSPRRSWHCRRTVRLSGDDAAARQANLEFVNRWFTSAGRAISGDLALAAASNSFWPHLTAPTASPDT